RRFRHCLPIHLSAAGSDRYFVERFHARRATAPAHLDLLLTFPPDLFDLLVGEMLDANETVLALTHPDQLVELGLQGRAIPVLRVLDEEHHEEGDDGRAGIDDELPGIRV